MFWILTRKNLTSNRACPYCNCQFNYGDCFPVSLKPQSDEISQEMKVLIAENNKLQQCIRKAKRLIKQREEKLVRLNEAIATVQEELKLGHGHVHVHGDG